MNSLHARYAAEIAGSDGPTGEFVEVLEIALCDFGGNVLWKGQPGREPTYQIPTRLRATKVGERVGSADTLVGYVTE